jgi:hypothetical protein
LELSDAISSQFFENNLDTKQFFCADSMADERPHGIAGSQAFASGFESPASPYGLRYGSTALEMTDLSIDDFKIKQQTNENQTNDLQYRRAVAPD